MDIKPGSYRKGGECEGDGEAIRTNKRQIIAPGRSGPRGEDAVCHAESSSNEHRGERLSPRVTRQLRAKWKSADEGLGCGGQLASTPTRKTRDSLKERRVFSVDLEFRQYDDWTGATDRRKTIRMRKVEHTARGHMRRAGERMCSRQPQLIPTQESNDRQGHAIRTLSLRSAHCVGSVPLILATTRQGLMAHVALQLGRFRRALFSLSGQFHALK